MIKHLPLIFILVNFSPVIPGEYIRVQHLVVYPLLLYVAYMNMGRSISSFRIKEFGSVFLFFFLMICWGGISTIIMKSMDFWNLIGVFSAIDSLVFPIAVICIVSYCTNNLEVAHIKRLFIVCINIYLFIMIIDGLLVLLQVCTGISWLFEFFVDSSRDGSVSEKALSMGRYTGIFNQPFEAGLAASLGMFLVCYRIKYFQKIHLLDFIGFVIIPFVGILSVSKAFLLICPPLLLVYLIHKNRSWIKHLLTFLFLTILGIMILFTFVIRYWNGSDVLLRYLDSNSIEDINTGVNTYSAGRYAEDSSVRTKMLYIISNDPIFGFGMSWRQGDGNDVIDGAFDSAYLQALIYGGIPYLVLYLLLLWTICYIAYTHRKLSPMESSFLLFFIFYVFLAGNGAPCFSQHKFTVAFFTMFTLLVHIMAKQRIIQNQSYPYCGNAYDFRKLEDLHDSLYDKRHR